MSKFSVGEIAVYTGPADFGVKSHEINSEVEVVLVNQIYGDRQNAFMRARREWPVATIYTIRWRDRNHGYVPEHQLRKKRPPEQPSAFSYDEIISMCNGTDIRPTERQVREKYICK